MTPPRHSPRAEGRRIAVLAAGVAVFAAFWALVLPYLATLDPVSRNVTVHRLRHAFCKPRVEAELHCLTACAGVEHADYKRRACESLPTAGSTEADQRRLETELYARSPCAARCATNWKTHDLWCREPAVQASLSAIDACVFEGATQAVFAWHEARCAQACAAEAPPDPQSRLTSADPCLVSCLLAGLVARPTPQNLRELAYSVHAESDAALAARLAAHAAPSVPADFDIIRRECRLQHVRAPFHRDLETKRAFERAFAACVAARLPAAAPAAPPQPRRSAPAPTTR